jgi:hypothetical protein
MWDYYQITEDSYPIIKDSYPITEDNYLIIKDSYPITEDNYPIIEDYLQYSGTRIILQSADWIFEIQTDDYSR